MTNQMAYRCACCHLLHNQAAAGLCVKCRYHQSSEINQTVKRHREHEEMLRERLEAASQWAEEATSQRKEFGEKMHWALRSRDRTIQVLRKINDMHELRADGSCKCGMAKGCKIASLLDDRGVQQLIRRVDDYEADRRERDRLLRELDATGDPRAWDEFVRRTEGPRSRRPDAGYA